MHIAYLLLGSNIEPRADYLKNALDKLAARLHIQKCSQVYETAAWGMKEGTAAFLNMVTEVGTDMEPIELLAYCIECEKELGRVRTTEIISRTIDIDVLLYDSEILHSENLVIPHPRLQLRRFTLIPLAEIAPDIIHPVLHKSMKKLLEECEDGSEVILYEKF